MANKTWDFTYSQVKEIKRLHSEGLSYASIARRFGCSTSPISNVLRSNQVKALNKISAPSNYRLLRIDELSEGQRRQYLEMIENHGVETANNYLETLSKFHFGIEPDKRRHRKRRNR